MSPLPSWFNSDTRKDNNNKSIAQEIRRAKQVGGRRQPGSGSTPYARHDVRTDNDLEELKHTSKASYTFKVDDWKQLALHATQIGRQPRMVIDFTEHKLRIVIEEGDYP